jgi:hypothetical protein
VIKNPLSTKKKLTPNSPEGRIFSKKKVSAGKFLKECGPQWVMITNKTAIARNASNPWIFFKDIHSYFVRKGAWLKIGNSIVANKLKGCKGPAIN